MNWMTSLYGPISTAAMAVALAGCTPTPECMGACGGIRMPEWLQPFPAPPQSTSVTQAPPSVTEAPPPPPKPTPEQAAQSAEMLAAQRWCNSPTAAADMQAAIPQFLGVSPEAATITNIKVMLTLPHIEGLNGLDGGVKIYPNCAVEVFWSNGATDWGEFGEWPDKYGQMQAVWGPWGTPPAGPFDDYQNGP